MHHPERQYNACANRRKQCSPNKTKSYSNPTPPRFHFVCGTAFGCRTVHRCILNSLCIRWVRLSLDRQLDAWDGCECVHISFPCCGVTHSPFFLPRSTVTILNISQTALLCNCSTTLLLASFPME